MLCEHDLLCLPINSLRWQLMERQCQGHNIRMYLCVNWRRIRKFIFCILYLHDSTGLCPPFCRKSLWLHIYMQYVVHLWIRDELDCPLIKLLISMESYHLNESQCTRAFLAIPPSFHSLALSSFFSEACLHPPCSCTCEGDVHDNWRAGLWWYIPSQGRWRGDCFPTNLIPSLDYLSGYDASSSEQLSGKGKVN